MSKTIEIYVDGRQSGRTTKCIQWAAENDAYIVCASQFEARRIFEAAKEMGLDIKYPITFGETTKLRGAFPTKLAVDNADWFLRYYLEQGRHEVGFATWEK